MCGFAGVVDPSASLRDELLACVSLMSETIRHRGPDADAVWCDESTGVALAHRRLAVIDLTEHGAQPMTSADGRWVLAFNGEIYNHVALAARLAGEGVRLRGHSDTEVLLEAIAHWSLPQALSLSNGMFAFALWDRRERTLHLARDRMGEKPLYYTMTPRGRLVFASELRALSRHPEVSTTVDPRSLALYLRHSFVPGEHSIHAGVWRLPPGTVLTHRAGDPALGDPQPYWQLEDVARPVPDEAPQDLDGLVGEVADLLQDAVRIRMVSDVPLGAFLSGGLDSTLVVALMQQASPDPVQTFTMSVGGSGDEAVHAAAVARHLGTSHEQIDLSPGDALRLATEVPRRYDEPFADPSALPTLMLCTAARRRVTVCLTGDGGDEVAAGYNRYQATQGMLRHLAAAPPPLRRALSRSLLRLPASRLDAALPRLPGLRGVPDPGAKVHKAARMIAAGAGHGAYRALTTFLEPGSVLLQPEEHPSPASARGGAPSELDDLHMMLFLDQLITLPDDMLVKVDRASMQVALECRVPLLDHRLVELLWRSPGGLKMQDGQSKWVFRQVLDRFVPRTLVERPKQGFDPPIAAWLRGPLADWAQDLLHRDRLVAQGLFDPAGVQRLLDEHRRATHDHGYAIWTLATFQAWQAETGSTARSVSA